MRCYATCSPSICLMCRFILDNKHSCSVVYIFYSGKNRAILHSRHEPHRHHPRHPLYETISQGRLLRRLRRLAGSLLPRPLPHQLTARACACTAASTRAQSSSTPPPAGYQRMSPHHRLLSQRQHCRIARGRCPGQSPRLDAGHPHLQARLAHRGARRLPPYPWGPGSPVRLQPMALGLGLASTLLASIDGYAHQADIVWLASSTSIPSSITPLSSSSCVPGVRP